MEPHTYILDLLYKFNQRTGSSYSPSRGYSIMQCYSENKMEYYPRDFNKYDWLIGTICRNYVLGNGMNIITLPTMPIYNPSVYAFLILDYYKATNYDELFNIIKYNMTLNTLQVRQMNKSKDLKGLIDELYENKHKFIGADKLFDALKPKYIRKVTLKRPAQDMDELNLDFKTLKLE